MNNEGEERFSDARRESVTFSESEIARFWNTLKIPTIATVAVLIIAHRTFGVSEFWRDAVLAGIMFVVLGYRAYYEYHAHRPSVVMVGVMAGTIVGIVTGIMRFIEHSSVYMILNLLSEPVILMTAGGVAGWGMSILLTKFGTMYSARIIPSFLRGHQKS